MKSKRKMSQDFGKTDELRESEPSVVVRQDSDAVVIDPMTLMPGEEEIIAKRLLDVLKG